MWRYSNPALDEDKRQRLVNELMEPGEIKTARAAVQAANEALREREPVWWDYGAPDLNRDMVDNTPYAGWYQRLQNTAK
ncbi:hypothetical protein ABDX87_28220 [Pseudomonas abietaniphila]